MIFTSGIICVPNPILLAHAVDVDFEFPQKATFQELTKQVERPGREAVAAPQIGVKRRVFAVNSSRMGQFGGHSIIVNPTLLFPDEVLPEMNDVEYEGCLSIPGRTLPVVRCKTMLLKAFTVAGEPFEVTLQGRAARIAQHEYDHLNGILITTRALEFAHNGAPRWQRHEIQRVVAKLKL